MRIHFEQNMNNQRNYARMILTEIDLNSYIRMSPSILYFVSVRSYVRRYTILKQKYPGTSKIYARMNFTWIESIIFDQIGFEFFSNDPIFVMLQNLLNKMHVLV